jgi:hypothetical protein
MFEVLIDPPDRAQVPNRDLTGFQRVAEPRWGEDGTLPWSVRSRPEARWSYQAAS